MPGTNKYAISALQKGMEELELREMHPLRVYRPTVHQQPIHESRSEELLVAGGKRCLAGWQHIYDPVTTESSPVCMIRGEFHVQSLNPADGRPLVCKAEKPFVKGTGHFFEYTFDNGERLSCTGEHLVLTLDGWKSISISLKVAPLIVRDATPNSTQRPFRSRWSGCRISSSVPAVPVRLTLE